VSRQLLRHDTNCLQSSSGVGSHHELTNVFLFLFLFLLSCGGTYIEREAYMGLWNDGKT
jgi:hypothetical protein